MKKKELIEQLNKAFHEIDDMPDTRGFEGDLNSLIENVEELKTDFEQIKSKVDKVYQILEQMPEEVSEIEDDEEADPPTNE